MKKITLALLICFLTSYIYAQNIFYSEDDNLYNQSVLETSDGGYLIASTEDCYTPNATTIEGCAYAIHLVKTNAVGDTLWTNKIMHNGSSLGDNMYENSDDTYSFFTISRNTYSCNGQFIWGYGYAQVQIYNVDANGNLLNSTAFPDDCALTLKDVVRLDENKYAILSVFDYASGWSYVYEGRLSIIDKNGVISKELTFANQQFSSGTLLKNSSDNIMLLYWGIGDSLHIDTYDMDLNLIDDTFNVEMGVAFRNSIIHIKELDNNKYGLMCYNSYVKIDNVRLFTFDQTASIISKNTLTLNRPTNFVEMDDSKFVIASLDTVNKTKNIQLTYLSSELDSLSSEVITGDEEEQANQLILNSNNQLVIVGSVNCCNKDQMVGPSQAFLQFRQIISTSFQKILYNNDFTIYPNPAQNSIQIKQGGSINSKDVTIHIFNMGGIQVLDASIEKEVIIEGLPVGTYHYNILVKNKVVTSGSFVKN